MANKRLVDILPLQRFATTGATLKRPVDIAHFSFDEDHQLHVDDARSLRYYYPCLPGTSLAGGFDTFRKWAEVDEHLDALLATLIQLERRNQGQRTPVDLVTWRGMLTKFMILPYNLDDSFEMNATVFQGQIFIEEDFPHRVARNAAQNKKSSGRWHPDEMSYWGYKFETVTTLSRPWGEMTRQQIEGRVDEITSNLPQYCQLVQTGVGSHTMVLGGEIDAVWDVRRDYGDKNGTHWVELKTSAAIRHQGQERRFEQKLLKFWAQSFLLGVKTIVVGFRDDNGKILTIEDFSTVKIPGMVQQKSQSWNRNVCINFVESVLAAIKAEVVGEGVWKIKHEKGARAVEIIKVQETGTGSILTEDFLRWRNSPDSKDQNNHDVTYFRPPHLLCQAPASIQA